MSKSTEGAPGDLAADLAALRQDVAQAAGHRVSEAVDEVKDIIASTVADAQSCIRAASGEIEACIERNPFTAVLIALGVGMSVGLRSRS